MESATSQNHSKPMQLISIHFKNIEKLFCIFGITILCSCNSTTNRANFPSDINEGKTLAENFLKKLKSKDYKSALLLMDTVNLRQDDFINFITKVDDNIGAINNFKFKEGNSNITVTNGKKSGDMTLIYILFHNENKTETTFIIEYDASENLIISGYNPTVNLK